MATFALMGLVAAMAAALFVVARRARERERSLSTELLAGELSFRTVVEQSLAAIYVIQDGFFRYVNPSWEEMFGYAREDVVDKVPVESMVAPEDRELVRENVRRRTTGEVPTIRYSFRGLTRDGRRIDVEVAGARTMFRGRPAVIGTALDQTKRNQLQREAVRAQKFEMLGLLAGGLVHDVNNILHSISGLAEMLETSLPPGPPREDAAEIERSAERAAVLTRRLLAFGRTREAAAGPRDLNAAVRDCAPMLRGAAGTSVALELELEEGLGRVRTEPGQLEQVLMNLVLNARDAMPGGGPVRIATRRGGLLGAGESARPCAVLSVRDSGAGMDRATLDRIFEPFFTTKEPGKGTGLGLPTVQRIAELAGGRVDVDSTPGAGTDVRVSLPLV